MYPPLELTISLDPKSGGIVSNVVKVVGVVVEADVSIDTEFVIEGGEVSLAKFLSGGEVVISVSIVDITSERLVVISEAFVSVEGAVSDDKAITVENVISDWEDPTSEEVGRPVTSSVVEGVTEEGTRFNVVGIVIKITVVVLESIGWDATEVKEVENGDVTWLGGKEVLYAVDSTDVSIAIEVTIVEDVLMEKVDNNEVDVPSWVVSSWEGVEKLDPGSPVIIDDTVDSVENVDKKAIVVLGKNDDSVKDIVVDALVKSVIVDCCISVVEMDSGSLIFNDEPVDFVDIVDNKVIVVLGSVFNLKVVDCCISVVWMDSGSLIFNDESVDIVDNVDNKAIVVIGANDDSVLDIEVFSVDKLMTVDCSFLVVDSVENVEYKNVAVLGKIDDSVIILVSFNISMTVDSCISVVEMVSGSLIINDEPVDSVENVENWVIGDNDDTGRDIVVGSLVKSKITDCCTSVESTVVGVEVFNVVGVIWSDVSTILDVKTVLVVSTVVVRVIIGSIMILGVTVVRKGFRIM